MWKNEKSGLLDRDFTYILEAAKKDPNIEELVLFGSRAMGNYKPGSDVDLAVKGEIIDRSTIRRLSECLNEELPLPYFFDVLDYNTIENEMLKTHIDRFGVVIYQKNKDYQAEFFKAGLVREKNL
ncbi:nucleotidyltransferase domain-containing protein [Acidaminobacter sp.]|uniref:nucleotidyltransferase domain-containing protein n=1 Tax=Acidaminobacter sp. TaxID=1872102 RepID=UPI00137F5B21|nr:nucleotidyltransferase domain-containing protein [Acidaminobacter sp.]MDK9710728.1 nucleotidyltransferase domain-containing protein [Acidaminobacter sp.]MZQ96673.1 nucleotidyltransferase domain-containing protein [Acidaminobacter sp.]